MCLCGICSLDDEISSTTTTTLQHLKHKRLNTTYTTTTVNNSAKHGCTNFPYLYPKCKQPTMYIPKSQSEYYQASCLITKPKSILVNCYVVVSQTKGLVCVRGMGRNLPTMLQLLCQDLTQSESVHQGSIQYYLIAVGAANNALYAVLAKGL